MSERREQRLRWGFKAEANRLAHEIRGELGLLPVDPLDPWALANHLAIPVYPLSALRAEAPFAVAHFMEVDAGAFSAMTVFCGTRRAIMHNDAHSAGRQASDLAHELVHALLGHAPTPALDARGCRDWDGEVEAEADCLAGALLIPAEAALLIARRGWPLEQAAQRYRVSVAMVRYRLNICGARKRIAYARTRGAGR